MRLRSVGWVFASVAVSFGISLLCWKIFPSGNDGQTAASWVQGVGTILTIAGAFLISEQQTRVALRATLDAQQAQEKARQHGIMAVAEAADEHARRMTEALESANVYLALASVYDKTIIDGVVRALGDAPVHEIGSRDGVLALLSIRDQFVFLGNAMEVFLARPWNHPELGPLLEQLSDPADRTQRLALLSQSETVLAGNVKVHLRSARDHYQLLRNAVLGPGVVNG